MVTNYIEKKITEAKEGDLLLITTDRDSYILSVHKGMCNLFYNYPVIAKDDFDNFEQEAATLTLGPEGEVYGSTLFLKINHFKDMYLFANDNGNELYLKYFENIKSKGYVATENQDMGKILNVKRYRVDDKILKIMDDVYRTFLIGTENMDKSDIFDRYLNQIPDDLWVSVPSTNAS